MRAATRRYRPYSHYARRRATSRDATVVHSSRVYANYIVLTQNDAYWRVVKRKNASFRCNRAQLASTASAPLEINVLD